MLALESSPTGSSEIAFRQNSASEKRTGAPFVLRRDDAFRAKVHPRPKSADVLPRKLHRSAFAPIRLRCNVSFSVGISRGVVLNRALPSRLLCVLNFYNIGCIGCVRVVSLA